MFLCVCVCVCVYLCVYVCIWREKERGVKGREEMNEEMQY